MNAAAVGVRQIEGSDIGGAIFEVAMGAEKYRVHFGYTLARKPRIFVKQGAELKREVARKSDLFRRICSAVALHIWAN